MKTDKFEFIHPDSEDNKALSYTLKFSNYTPGENKDNDKKVIKIILEDIIKRKKDFLSLKNKNSYSLQGNTDFKVNKNTANEITFGFQIGFSPNLSEFLSKKSPNQLIILDEFISQVKNKTFYQLMNNIKVTTKKNLMSDLDNESQVFTLAYEDSIPDNDTNPIPKFDKDNDNHVKIFETYLKKQKNEKINYTNSVYIDKSFLVKDISGISQYEEHKIRQCLGLLNNKSHKFQI